MTIIKDFEYYEQEVIAILNGDIDTLKARYGFGDCASIEEFIIDKFAGQDSVMSGFMINQQFGIESAMDEDAYVVFYRDNQAQYAVGNGGDFIVNKGNRIEVVAENDTNNALYKQACASEGFAENIVEIGDYENELREQSGLFVVAEDEIKPLKRKFKPS